MLKKKKRALDEQSTDTVTNLRSKRKCHSSQLLKPSETKSKDPNLLLASPSTEVPLGSVAKVSRIFHWVKNVSNSYEPTEQGSIVPSVADNTEFELPDCVDDVVVPEQPQTGEGSRRAAKTGSVHQRKDRGGASAGTVENQRKPDVAIGRSNTQNKAVPGAVDRRTEPSVQTPRGVQARHRTRPTLQILKAPSNDEGSPHNFSPPITPFSPVLPRSPPVIATHSRQRPSPILGAPTSFVPHVPLTAQSVPMAVDCEMLTRTIGPNFPESSTSDLLATSPNFFQSTPNLPESTSSFSKASPNFCATTLNVPVQPFANFQTATPNNPVDSSPTFDLFHNSAANVAGLQSESLNFSSSQSHTARGGEQSSSQDCEIGMDIDDQQLEEQIKLEVRLFIYLFMCSP